MVSLFSFCNSRDYFLNNHLDENLIQFVSNQIHNNRNIVNNKIQENGKLGKE